MPGGWTAVTAVWNGIARSTIQGTSPCVITTSCRVEIGRATRSSIRVGISRATRSSIAANRPALNGARSRKG